MVALAGDGNGGAYTDSPFDFTSHEKPRVFPNVHVFPSPVVQNLKIPDGCQSISSVHEPGDSIVHDSSSFELRTCDVNTASNHYFETMFIHSDDALALGPRKESSPSERIVNMSEDGYNWRKYGQKQVKGSEYPRSYYKCTHPNCEVKKKVERSHDGQITEIIYKSSHNHPKPQVSRRPAMGSCFSANEMETSEGGAFWKLGGRRILKDSLDRTSPNSVVTELSGILFAEDRAVVSSTLSNHDDSMDEATHSSASYSDGFEDEEIGSNKRKRDADTCLSSHAVRESRVVIQIESDVDILDDGYRWRKYGQKVVKGNPNPRSYYKCTNTGCLVRKHIERASHDLKFVITTYEGKHNHKVPAVRSSGNVTTPCLQPGFVLPRSTTSAAPKPPSYLHDFVPWFDTKVEIGPEFLGSNFFPQLDAMKFSLPPIFQLRSAMPMPYGSLETNFDYVEANMDHIVQQGFPAPLPSDLPQSSSLPFSDVGFYNSTDAVRSALPFQYAQPKQEQNDHLFDANANALLPP